MDILESGFVKAQFKSKQTRALLSNGGEALGWDSEELVTTPYGLSIPQLAKRATKENKRFSLLNAETGEEYRLRQHGMTQDGPDFIYLVNLIGSFRGADRFLVVPVAEDNISAELFSFYTERPASVTPVDNYQQYL